MPTIGPTELIIILVIVLIIFGVGRLPEIGGAIGKSIREFRDASKEPGGDKPKDAKETVEQEQSKA
jgi:sec-independent protein translocase protein TatA